MKLTTYRYYYIQKCTCMYMYMLLNLMCMYTALYLYIHCSTAYQCVKYHSIGKIGKLPSGFFKLYFSLL